VRRKARISEHYSADESLSEDILTRLITMNVFPKQMMQLGYQKLV
jgi:hypothetical protein